MKRYGNLWPQIIDFDNILLAARNAQKGKRFPRYLGKFAEELSGSIKIFHQKGDRYPN
jgi:hypothetical protein